MKRILSVMLAIGILMSCMTCAVVSFAAGTSTAARYPDALKTAKAAYSDSVFSKVEESGIIPGLVSTNVLGETSSQMTPQGFCYTDRYMLISAYEHDRAYNSVVYVLSKADGRYLTTLVAPEKNHFGGICFDGERIFIAKSTSQKVACFPQSQIDAAVLSGEDSVPLTYESLDCGMTASFITYFKGLVYVGYYNESGAGTLKAFRYDAAADTLVAGQSLSIAQFANGGCFVDGGDKGDFLAIGESYGSINNSYLHLYALEGSTPRECTKIKMPPMLEEMDVDENGRFSFIFESAATTFNTGLIQCRYPMDRICSLSVEDLLETVIHRDDSLEWMQYADKSAKVLRCLNNAQSVVIGNTLGGCQPVCIGENCFENVGDLKTITIPRTVKTIENSAFAACSALQSVRYGGSVYEWNAVSVGADNDTLKTAQMRFDDALIMKLSATSFVYDGKVKTPKVTVKTASGKVSTVQKDYDVNYAKGRKNIGTYAVKIVFKGAYKGSKTLVFSIVPKGVALKWLSGAKRSAAVQWYAPKTKASGYQLSYSLYKNFSTAKTVTIRSGKVFAKKLTGLKSGRVYYVRVRTYTTLGGKNYFSAWSGSRKVKVK